MQQSAALDILRRIKPVLMQQFGVVRLALFGSTARNEATEHSDVDILVSFDGAATSARYFGVQFYLEDCLGCAVDLVTDKAVRPQLVRRNSVAYCAVCEIHHSVDYAIANPPYPLTRKSGRVGNANPTQYN